MARRMVLKSRGDGIEVDGEDEVGFDGEDEVGVDG